MRCSDSGGGIWTLAAVAAVFATPALYLELAYYRG